MKNTANYYARNEEEREMDKELSDAFHAENEFIPTVSPIKLLALFSQNQGIISMLRHMEDKLDEIERKVNKND